MKLQRRVRSRSGQGKEKNEGRVGREEGGVRKSSVSGREFSEDVPSLLLRFSQGWNIMVSMLKSEHNQKKLVRRTLYGKPTVS